jgi:hypothetical protein
MLNGTLTINSPVSQPKQVTPVTIVQSEEPISLIVYQSDQQTDQENPPATMITVVDTDGVTVSGCVEVHVNRNPVGGGGSIRVNVPTVHGFLGGGFVLSLPSGVIDIDAPVLITLADGSALPSWLSFDPVAQTFTATDVPAGIQSLNIVISQGKQTWSLQIAAATPTKAS